MRKSVLAFALLLGGCQTWGPTWSEVTGYRYTFTELNRRPAIINQIDNQGSFASDPIKIEPGLHRLVLQGPTPGWPGGAPLQVYNLDAAPCKRYYINAQFENTITQDWKPVIDYVEPISGCKIVAAQK